MPNWCWNYLEVHGDEKQLQEFVEKSENCPEGSEFTFNGTHPMPEDLDITCGTQTQEEKEQAMLNKAKYGCSTWYEWCCKEWGTKWDACEAHIDHNDINYFAVSFETAWSPPIAWIDNIIQDFPNLQFTLEYEEPGMGFGGRLLAQHNKTWDNDHWDLDQASECCEGEVYNTDDEEFSLPQIPLKEQKKWVGKDKTYKTLKDIPEYWKYPDHQCGICGEETETISINVADIKPAKIKINDRKRDHN